MPPSDPWLTTRMRDYAVLRQAEAELRPAVDEAVRHYLGEVASAVLGELTFTAAADDNNTPPDLNRFPSDSSWVRLVERYVRPVARRIFRRSYQDLASADTEAFSAQASRYTEGIAERLLGFPRRVWERLRARVGDGLRRGQPYPQMRAQVSDLLLPSNFDGQADTLTRTEVHTAVAAGAMAAAVDEQTRTGRAWTKTWISTRDDRVRLTHRAADGQRRPLGAPFLVGGFPMRFPGDPLGPAAEVMNCRCSARYQPVDDATTDALLETP